MQIDNETHSLISSDKVEDTKVYNASGEKLGSIDSLMINKREGNVAYAVMSFGGFLGMGEKYHPLPWDQLNYNEDDDGYVVNLTKDQLEGGPTIEKQELNRLTDPVYGREIYNYYGSPIYWG